MSAKTTKMGRPEAEINQAVFEGLCNIQCTLTEIAGILKVSERTIERWCHKVYGETFVGVYKKYSAGGKISLRRNQFKLAETNATMAIWLGKQYLNQRDHIDVKLLDAQARAEAAITECMQRTGKARTEAIELLKPYIPEISTLVH